MKLQNKKTGEIVDLYEGLIREDGERITIKPVAVLEKCYIYHSLAELNSEWEEYEESKGYWYIRDDGSGVGFSPLNDSTVAHRRSIIGNYFESEEEARRALEKLKTWKRLKDKGFRFDNWDLDADGGDVNVLLRSDKYKGNQVYALEEDLDLLFGGEE